jgi:hypothetical protein
MASKIGGWLTVAPLAAVGTTATAAAWRRRKSFMAIRCGGRYSTVCVVTVDRPIAAARDMWRNEQQLSVFLDRPVTVQEFDDHQWRSIPADPGGGAGGSPRALPTGRAGRPAGISCKGRWPTKCGWN